MQSCVFLVQFPAPNHTCSRSCGGQSSPLHSKNYYVQSLSSYTGNVFSYVCYKCEVMKLYRAVNGLWSNGVETDREMKRERERGGERAHVRMPTKQAFIQNITMIKLWFGYANVNVAECCVCVCELGSWWELRTVKCARYDASRYYRIHV